MTMFQAFVGQLERNGISLDRKGRLELSELLSRTVPLNSSLRFELIREFEKQGLSAEDSFRAAEMFFEMVEKGEL